MISEWDYIFIWIWKASLLHNEQRVSDINFLFKASLTVSYPITNSKWVTWYICWKAISSHILPWSTASEWQNTFLNGYLTIYPPVTNSLWVTLQFLKGSLNICSLWLTDCEWHLNFLKDSYYISHQQEVGNIDFSLRKSHHLAKWTSGNGEWHFEQQSYHTCHHPWPTGSEWQCTSFWKPVTSSNQQQVGVTILQFLKAHLTTSPPMITIRQWVTLHFSLKEVSHVSNSQCSNIYMNFTASENTACPFYDLTWCYHYLQIVGNLSPGTFSYILTLQVSDEIWDIWILILDDLYASV